MAKRGANAAYAPHALHVIPDTRDPHNHADSAQRCGWIWARLDSNQGPTDYEFGPELRQAEMCRVDCVCLSRFCSIVAFVISAHLGGSGGPNRGPASV
jgi:hypothetical protein